MKFQNKDKGAVGKAFDKNLAELSVTIFPQQGLILRKTNPEFIVTGKGSVPKKGPPDLVGFLSVTGYLPFYVSIEAKTIQVPSLQYLKSWKRKADFNFGDKKYIKPHQHEHLITLESWNGLGFYLIRVIESEFGMHSRHFLLSAEWCQKVWIETNKKRSLSMGLFDEGNVTRFTEIENLAGLPRVLKRIALKKLGIDNAEAMQNL
jgi:hypothetical protein